MIETADTAAPQVVTESGRAAFARGLHEEMQRNDRLIVLGETVRSGGAAGVTAGLHGAFGPTRVVETPVSENGIVGMALGLALAGFRPVVEIYSADFLLAVANEVMNDIAKWRTQHGQPHEPLPITIRGCMAATEGLGPEHSQSMEPFFMHAPGLQILTPGTVRDAHAGMLAALRANVPTLLFEHRRIYEHVDQAHLGSNALEMGVAHRVRSGDRATVVAWGWMRQEAENACGELESQGIAVDLIDPVSIRPFDFATVLESVERSGVLVVVEEAFVTGSVGAEIIARASEAQGRQGLRTSRVAMPDVIHPYDGRLERDLLPTSTDIVAAVRSLLQ